ncbi:TIGR00296 family protein [Methanoregula sp.]|uniref:TIGR00296 family protein n=1 Tax=Methanoregula sp. TaxID=2052170 RepID=UPI00356A50E0
MQLLTVEEGDLALRIARGTIEYATAKKPKPELPTTAVFRQKRGVFVTISKDGELRGCIGLPYPVMPLGEALEHAAKAAALEDPRFPPIKKDELGTISVEVTILTVPVPLAGKPDERVRQVEIGKHGLIVRGMGTSGLLLPQVATEYGWDAETFLDHTCRKAGLPGRCWTSSDVEFLTFEGQIFSEKTARGTV